MALILIPSQEAPPVDHPKSKHPFSRKNMKENQICSVYYEKVKSVLISTRNSRQIQQNNERHATIFQR